MLRSGMVRRIVVVGVMMLAACGGKKEGKGKGGGDKVEKTKDLTGLFTGSAPTLPAEVAAAKLGDTQDVVAKAIGTDTTYLPSKTYAGVSYDLDYSRNEKKLDKISVSADSDLEPVLAKLWGPPIKTKKGTAFWFDPKSGVRAYLPDYGKGKRVAFDRYDSLETLLGPTGWDLAFAQGKPLIGASLDEIEKAWGGKLCDFKEAGTEVKAAIEEYQKEWASQWHDLKHSVRLCLAEPRFVDEGTPYGDRLDIGRMGKVEEAVFELRTGGSPELQKQLIAFADAKFGKAIETTSSTGTKERWYFDPAGHHRAVLSLGDDSSALWYGRYLPVAELIAADKPGVLSVATKSMPGGAPKAIAAEDAEHFNPHGTLPLLVFPATDWVHQETEVQLESYDKAPTTYAYRVSVWYEAPAADDVHKLLDAKLGAGKAQAGGTDKDTTWAWKAKDGSKVTARQTPGVWSIEVAK